MLVFFLIATVLFTNTLAVIVAVKNRFSLASVYHLLATVFFAVWAITNIAAEKYSGDISKNSLYNGLAFLFAFLGMVMMVMFSRFFARPYTKAISSGRALVELTLICAFGVLTFSELVAGTVERGTDGKLVFLQGPLIWLYALVMVAGILAIVRNLLLRAKHGNYAEKNQARFMVFGLSSVMAIGLATNVLMPALNPEFGNYGLLVVFLILFIVIPTSYAMLKHRLLDVRPLAARTIALLLLFCTLGAAYIEALFWLNRVFLQGEQPSGTVLTVYAVVMVALGFMLHPMYRLYRRVISRLLLHRLYDSQDVINELNNVLVANMKLSALMPELQKVIRRNLDARFTLIKLQGRGVIYHQGTKRLMSREELAHIDIALTPSLRKKFPILSMRDIANDPALTELSSVMLRQKIAVVAPIKQGGSTLGIMYISEKNSELPYTNQDLDIVSIIINQAGLAIQNALLYHELTTINDSLQERVNGATRELRATNAKLVSIDKAKDEFISIASHQLRTPLTTIKGYLSMLLEGGLGKVPAAHRTVLQQTFDSSQRMAYVVSDLLNLTRLRTGKFDIELRPVNLADLVASEVVYLADQAKSKGIGFRYTQPKFFPDLMLDETKIRQVVKSLLYNALYYTLPGGTIEAEVSEQGNSAFFRVKDNGIGVPKEEQRHLFTQFYRAKNARDVRPDGTGVGLYLAKKVIAGHHGKMLVDSVEGKGSSFGFSLSKKDLIAPENTV